MVGRDLVAVSAERLQELQEELDELARGAHGPSAAPREPLSLAALHQRLATGRDLLRRPVDEEALPTALPAVDRLLAGGVARSCLTELRGAPSSGRFALVVALLAATTARGEAAALIDLGDQLDPQEAARCGVVLPRLLWARPERLRHALAATEIALGGDFPLVVLELGMPPLPYGSSDEHAWLRLARAARLHRAALLVATPWRVTGSAAGEVLALSRRRGLWLGSGVAPRLLAGMEASLCREKSRRLAEPAAAALGLRAGGLLGALPLPPMRGEERREERREPPARAATAPPWPRPVVAAPPPRGVRAPAAQRPAPSLLPALLRVRRTLIDDQAGRAS
ncbi:MAG TPA: hypothetical protein VGV61_15640 [Thermoanaerobaculia bacterium]|nr:hypothetical protein [Thermoanaerobaculia bacterium]